MCLQRTEYWKHAKKLAFLLICACCLTSCFLDKNTALNKWVDANYTIVFAICILTLLAGIGHFFGVGMNDGGEYTNNIYDRNGNIIGGIGTGKFYSGDADAASVTHSLTFIATAIIAVCGYLKGFEAFVISGVACIIAWWFLSFYLGVHSDSPLAQFLCSRIFVFLRRLWGGALLLLTLLFFVA